MEAPRGLIRAYDVARRLNYSTWTIKKWARDGRLPGVVFLGRHIRFDPDAIDAFIRAGGKRLVPTVPTPAPHVAIHRHGCHEHASGPLRNDRSRRDPARALADLVKPDSGVRDYDPMAQPPDLGRVPPAQYVSGALLEV